MRLSDFLFIDLKDWQNYVAIAIAIPLLFWGIKTIISVLK